MKNFYQILGLHKDASSAEIKTAFRKLSKKFHPDVNQGDKFFEELFKEIQSAYEVLGDEDNRAAYDLRSGYRKTSPNSSNSAQEQPAPQPPPRTEPKSNPKQEPDKTAKATGETTVPKSKKGRSVWGIIIFILVGGFFHAVFKNANKTSSNSTVAKASTANEYVDTFAVDTPLAEPVATTISEKVPQALMSSFEGVWIGSAYQYDVNQRWAIRLTCHNGLFSVKYPSLGCAGNLSVMQADGDTLILREKLTSPGSCYDDGIIVISIKEDGRIEAFFNDSQNTTIIAIGHLTKMKR